MLRNVVSSVFLLCSTGLLTFFFFFFNATATPEIYPLPLHDALPISRPGRHPPRRRRHVALARARAVLLRALSPPRPRRRRDPLARAARVGWPARARAARGARDRSEEHTSELQSQSNLVCRLLLEKKK